MSRPNPLIVLGLLLVVVAGYSAVTLTKGGLYIGRHEGDMLHLLAILFRMEQGHIPHLDFMTPIGAFAFLPIHGFLTSGYGVDQAILWAQSAVALGLLPLVWWAAWTRFSPVLGYIFAALCLVLVLALVHGETVEAVSISMHYNRWAWALSYVAVALAILPHRGRGAQTIDGVVIGLCAAGLLMIKVTYAVGFFPVLLLGLILRGQITALVAALVAGSLVLIGVTFWAGIGYWPAYLGDLLAVAGSDVRPKPGREITQLLVAPAYIGGTITALLAVILLRRAGAQTGGLLVFVALPGCLYVTYQNFANDPQWLALFGLLVLMLIQHTDPEEEGGRKALTYTAIAILAFAAPAFVNLAYSPLRHAAAAPEVHAPILPDSARHSGFQTTGVRANRIDGVFPLDGPGSGLEAYRALVERVDPSSFQGETFLSCEVVLGLPGWIQAMASDVAAQGYGDGTRVFVADLIGAYWLYNDQAPLENGSPWYYGGLPGLDSADYLLVPLCPIAPKVQVDILGDLEATDKTFTEVYRSQLFVLYSIS